MANKVHACHILVASEQEANVLKFDLQRGADFGEVAKEKSICPSAKKGGDLGWFGRGQMVKEFEHSAFNAEVGKIVGPIRTQIGWHLIKIVEQK